MHTATSLKAGLTKQQEQQGSRRKGQISVSRDRLIAAKKLSSGTEITCEPCSCGLTRAGLSHCFSPLHQVQSPTWPSPHPCIRYRVPTITQSKANSFRNKGQEWPQSPNGSMGFSFWVASSPHLLHGHWGD